MPAKVNKWLIAGGSFSALAACLQLTIPFGGPDWLGLFNAGDGIAKASGSELLIPSLFIVAAAIVLATSALYAFSGAGLIRQLPFLRTGLFLASAIFLVRGVALLPALALTQEPIDIDVVLSSFIFLACGLVYAVGTAAEWRRLSHLRHGPITVQIHGLDW